MTAKAKTSWTTDDGREFDSEAEATAHAEFAAAKGAYDKAKHAYGRLLAGRQKTADGKPFELTMRDYWFVRERHNGLPTLRRVSFYVWNVTVDERDDCVAVIDNAGADGGPRFAEYRIDQLYARESEAKKALLAAQLRFLDQARLDVERLRQEIGGPTP
jgi:hypothetical protein